MRQRGISAGREFRAKPWLANFQAGKSLVAVKRDLKKTMAFL
jgi:hypothetical protein